MMGKAREDPSVGVPQDAGQGLGGFGAEHGVQRAELAAAGLEATDHLATYRLQHTVQHQHIYSSYIIYIYCLYIICIIYIYYDYIYVLFMCHMYMI